MIETLILLGLTHDTIAQSNSQPHQPTCHLSDRSLLLEGNPVALSNFPCDLSHGNKYQVSIINEEKSLLYVHDFLGKEEIDAIVAICSDQDRFDSSPLRMHSATLNDGYGVDQAVRTSSSCPLLFAYYYMPHLEKLKEQAPHLLPELELTWNITQRAANFFQVSASQIEPLQMLMYQPGQYYKPHHDHRGFYDLMNSQSDRAYTMLLFMNDVHAGGHLKFDRLGLQFIPRRGDAVVWSNVDKTTGLVDHEMVHQGMPPEPGSEKMAINLWVREEPLTSPQEAAARQS